MQYYNGMRTSSGNAKDAVMFMNFARQFPEIAKDKTIDVYKQGDNEYTPISLTKFAEEFEKVINTVEFSVQKLESTYGAEWAAFADKQTKKYLDHNGIERQYTDYEYQAKFYSQEEAEDRLYNAYSYLENNIYSDIDMYSFTRLILDNNEEFTQAIKDKGYDGIIQSENGDEAVAFSPNQIKLTTNLNPTQNEDIRYSLTPSQKTKLKQYTKAESEAVINDIISDKLNFEDKYGELKGKSKQEVINKLWKALNTVEEGKRIAVGLDIADFIMQNSVWENVYNDSKAEYDRYVIETLQPYLKSIDLDSIKSEIKYKYGNNVPYLMWGKQKGEKGIAPDVLAQQLNEEGFNITADTSADIFFAIDESYKKANASLKAITAKNVSQMLDKTAQEEVRQDIARKILLAYETKGKDTAFAKVIKDYESKINTLLNKLKQTKEANKVINRIVDNARKLGDYKKGKYDAGFLADARLENYAKLLTKLNQRGNLIKKPQSAREAIAVLAPFYTKDILDGGTETSYFAESIQADILEITDKFNSVNQGENMKPQDKILSLSELKAMQRITDHIKHLYTTYNTVFFKGKTIDTAKYASERMEAVKQTPALPTMAIQSRLLLNPADYLAMTDRYSEGFMTDVYNEVQKAFENKLVYQRTAKEQFDAFFKENPKYEESLRQPLQNGLTKGQAISLYLTFNRKHGKKYLTMPKAQIKIADDRMGKKGNFKEAESRAKLKSFSQDLLPNLSATDMQFIQVVQEYFKWSGEQISKVELDKWGFSNPKENDYFPISISGDDIFSMLGRNQQDGFSLSRPGFTYKTQKVTPGKTLFIGNVIDIIYSQINQASAFVGFSVPVNEIAKLYNVKVDGTNFKQQYGRVNRDIKSYLNSYLQDIQGINKSLDGMDRVLGKMRSWMARGALGLNPKVWFNQLTSIPMAKSVGLNYRNQLMGFVETTKLLNKKGEFVALYNELTELMPEVWQRYEGSIAIKEALGLQTQNKFDKLMDFTTMPIQVFDKFAILSLWQGAKMQMNGDTIKAVALMKDIIRKTQPNYEAINRSEIGRSKNQMTKMFTMFMTQPLQNFSRMYTAIDKFMVAKKSNNISMKEQASKELKATVSAFTAQTVAFVMVSELFKLLLNTDRKDRDYNEISIFADIMRDLGGAILGMFPLVRDIYTFFSAGFEPTNAVYSGVSNLLNAVVDLWKGVEMLFDGEAQEDYKINSSFRRVILGLTQTFGMPFRNVERYITGTISTFSPQFAIKYKSLFYKQQYTQLLNKATQKGDSKLADSIIEQMLKDKGVVTDNSTVRRELYRLYKDGYKPFPTTLNVVVTHDSVQYPLDKEQKRQFERIYSGATRDVASVMMSQSYQKLTEEQKAKTIKNIYDIYYDKAKSSVLKVSDKQIVIANSVNAKQYAQFKAFVSTAELKKDRRGNAISGSKKKQVINHVNSLELPRAEKMMYVLLNNYTITDTDFRGYTAIRAKRAVSSYISSLNITADEKKALLVACGLV